MIRKLALLIVMLVLASVLAACGGANNTSNQGSNKPAQQKEEGGNNEQAAQSGGNESVTLRFAWWGNDPRHQATLEALATKMEKAAELLSDHSWKAFQVSEMVGYANVKNFIRTFKEYYGQTPGQYRRK